MARTTENAVRGIIDVSPDVSDLTAFITPANELVTECCVDDDATLSDIRLELIERYLAAHFYTVYDPRYESEKAGSVSAKYQSKVDLGLSTSHYGQMAMTLDTTGGLAALNEKTKRGTPLTAGITWLGTERDEDDDEEDS